jgi:hypothetical protein
VLTALHYCGQLAFKERKLCAMRCHGWSSELTLELFSFTSVQEEGASEALSRQWQLRGRAEPGVFFSYIALLFQRVGFVSSSGNSKISLGGCDVG